MLICNHTHTKTFEESTFIPAIFSPRLKDSKSFVSFAEHEKEFHKRTYQMWMQLVQSLHERTLPTKQNIHSSLEKSFFTSTEPRSPSKGLQRSQTWVARDTTTSWTSDKLNSNKQVTQLINHYSNLLSVDNRQVLTQQFNDRPKSILRPIGSANKFRFNKEVTFAATET